MIFPLQTFPVLLQRLLEVCEHYHVRLLFTPKLTNSTKQRKISWHLLSLKTSNQVMLQTATIIKKENLASMQASKQASERTSKRESEQERDRKCHERRIKEYRSISRFRVFIFISHWLNNRDRSHTTENKNMGIMLRESDKFSASSLLYCVRNACEFTPSAIHSPTPICLYSLCYHL